MIKIIFRSLALIIAAITIYSQFKFANVHNLILYLGFMCSLLAFSEYDSIDLLKKLNTNKISSVRISTTWTGKIFEILSFIFYVTYFFIFISK